MAHPNSRQTLIDYCLRKLGHPVIEIGVEETQLEDRVDEALELYQEFHTDAVLRTFVKHQVTQTDIDNDYISIDDSIAYVTRMIPVSSKAASNFFDIKYQISLNDIYDLNTFIGDLAYYNQIKQYLTTLDMMLKGQPTIDFNRHLNKIYIHAGMNGTNIKVGDYLIFEVYKIVDPDSNTDVYNDYWLKKYLTQLIKQQWGQNLSLFSGITMLGGVQVNGPQIFQEASQELAALEAELRSTYEMPIDFFIG